MGQPVLRMPMMRAGIGLGLVQLLVAWPSVADSLLDEIAAADRQADATVAAISSTGALKRCQARWRAAWLKGIGGLPTERTPLNAKEGPVVKCDGFTFQNVLFESQPGVYVVGHLALPDRAGFSPPYACVLMPLGHSDTGMNERYADHLARTARAGMAAFAWDPISQGERRQSDPKYDYMDNCSTEHARLGARGWLVGWNFARFRIWDAIRAVDYVLTRPEIDGRRLGVAGNSGGGTMSTYLQAWDDRITAAFPNCFVSSIRAVCGDRGCHDAEQFYFGQLRDGVNHAAMLALGAGRVSLATGSRWKDYFPHAGAVETFAVYSNLWTRLQLPTRFPWHFHCDGPHGLPPATRAAQVDWMRHCLLNAAPPLPLEDYWREGVAAKGAKDDPVMSQPMPFRMGDTSFTQTHQVRDLKGFRSVYALIAERALDLRSRRKPKSREELREVVCRRANIRPLDRLASVRPSEFVTDFDWWYLKGSYGHKAENKSAILSMLGRSYVGEEAEGVLRKGLAEFAANGNRPVVLKARGWDCIAAAHAYAAAPQLFGVVEFSDPPPSWTELVTNPDPSNDSFAIGVWGALEEYDWVDLIPRGL